MCSLMTNGVKNIPMRRRDIHFCKEMLGKIKHDVQGETIMKSSDHVDVSNQLVELLPTIKMHYSDV